MRCPHSAADQPARRRAGVRVGRLPFSQPTQASMLTRDSTMASELRTTASPRSLFRARCQTALKAFSCRWSAPCHILACALLPTASRSLWMGTGCRDNSRPAFSSRRRKISCPSWSVLTMMPPGHDGSRRDRDNSRRPTVGHLFSPLLAACNTAHCEPALHCA